MSAMQRGHVKYLLVALWFAVAIATEAQSADPFVIGMGQQAIEMHPQQSYTVSEAQFFTAIYEGLVVYDSLALQALPGVAEKWEIEDEGRRYRFHLREEARYWNGDRVEATHFVAAWQELLNPQKNAYYSFLLDPVMGAQAYREGTISDYSQVGISAPSPSELLIELTHPTPFFLATLTHYSLAPIHPRMQKIKDWSRFPAVLSNGPYVVAAQNSNEIQLTLNEYYWDRENIAIPTIYIMLGRDKAYLAQGIRDNKIDWVPSGLELSETIPPETIIINPLLGSSFFFFVADKMPWNDSRVRRALALLAPWDRIRDSSIYTFPATSLLPRIPRYEPLAGIAHQNREEAWALLQEAGYPRGEGLPHLVIRIPSSSEDRRIALLLKETWNKNINLMVQIEEVASERYYSTLKESNYTIGRLSWIADYLDPLAILQLWTSSSNLNDARFSSEEYDALIQRSILERGGERLQTLRKAESILVDGALLMPINHTLALNFINLNRVGGWSPNLLDIHPVKFFFFKKGAPIPGVAALHHLMGHYYP